MSDPVSPEEAEARLRRTFAARAEDMAGDDDPAWGPARLPGAVALSPLDRAGGRRRPRRRALLVGVAAVALPVMAGAVYVARDDGHHPTRTGGPALSVCRPAPATTTTAPPTTAPATTSTIGSSSEASTTSMSVPPNVSVPGGQPTTTVPANPPSTSPSPSASDAATSTTSVTSAPTSSPPTTGETCRPPGGVSPKP